MISDPCTDCRGAGRIRKNAKIQVNIPAGIDNGQTLNMRGEGEAGYKGGPRGNLYITVSVRGHKQFTRRGYDLLWDMHIPFSTAALGGDLVVPTLKDPVKYSVPAGTQNGTTFRLKEQGIQRLNSTGKGDLFVTVTVDVPKKLTDEQRELLIKFAQTENGGKAEKKGFFKK
jgi:molecular chaperone DnaJ